MTEGADVLGIETVMLTRPTQSEALFMQMVGRGMRGPEVHGTKTVNLVNFNDTWDIFDKWCDLKIIPDGTSVELNEEKKPYIRDAFIYYDWKDCVSLYKLFMREELQYNRVISVPSAWYLATDYDGGKHIILVYENQLDGYKKLKSDASFWKNDRSIKASSIINKYFSGFTDKPKARDLDILMDNYRDMEIPPEIHGFANRKKFDSLNVARRAKAAGRNISEYAIEIFDSNSMARDLYSNKEKYLEAVVKASEYDGVVTIYGQKVEFLPEELVPYDQTPYYDLDELVSEVKNENPQLNTELLAGISWTDRYYKDWYGMHHGNHYIEINKKLNSKDVLREVVKFVIYHELIHLTIPNHSKQFKDMEQMYPEFAEWEHFLVDTANRFDQKGWGL